MAEQTPTATMLQAVTMAQRIINEPVAYQREFLLAQALCWYVKRCALLERLAARPEGFAGELPRKLDQRIPTANEVLPPERRASWCRVRTVYDQA